jgi:nucleoid DNA-binding protein
MTKLEVAITLRDKTGIPHRMAVEAVELFLSTVKDALKTGEKVSLVRFGTFLVKSKRARRGRNPRTGEKIQVPPKHVVVFKPGREFREQVNLQ